MVLLLTAVVHATEENDTTVIKNARQVMVITNDSLQQVKVLGKENDDHYVYENTIQLVDSNYVSTTRIGRDRWELIPSVKVGKKKDDIMAIMCR